MYIAKMARHDNFMYIATYVSISDCHLSKTINILA